MVAVALETALEQSARWDTPQPSSFPDDWPKRKKSSKRQLKRQRADTQLLDILDELEDGEVLDPPAPVSANRGADTTVVVDNHNPIDQTVEVDRPVALETPVDSVGLEEAAAIPSIPRINIILAPELTEEENEARQQPVAQKRGKFVLDGPSCPCGGCYEPTLKVVDYHLHHLGVPPKCSKRGERRRYETLQLSLTQERYRTILAPSLRTDQTDSQLLPQPG